MMADKQKLVDLRKRLEESKRIENELRVEIERLNTEISKYRGYIKSLGSANPMNDPWDGSFNKTKASLVGVQNG